MVGRVLTEGREVGGEVGLPGFVERWRPVHRAGGLEKKDIELAEWDSALWKTVLPRRVGRAKPVEVAIW